jgi:hypothetical protein
MEVPFKHGRTEGGNGWLREVKVGRDNGNSDHGTTYLRVGGVDGRLLAILVATRPTEYMGTCLPTRTTVGLKGQAHGRVMKGGGFL